MFWEFHPIKGIWILFFVICNGNAERTRDKMYLSIDGAAACFRRLNGTHQFGCSSERGGNVGVVHLIQNDSDVNWLVEHGDAPPYMPVLGPEMFTDKVMRQLKDSNKVSGVLLVQNLSNIPDSFSHEDKCPNHYSGLQGQCDNPWNPYGSGLMFIDWGFPIFFVKGSDTTEKIVDCFRNFNFPHKEYGQAGNPLCAIEMNSYMHAAVSSEICIRRSHMITNFNPVRFCDALGDKNIILSMPARTSRQIPERSIIVVSVRLDSSSMFDELVPGALTPVTGIVALLATAQALSKVLSVHGNNTLQSVLFTLLHGESYDYIGSSRLLWDMEQGYFPYDEYNHINTSHIGLFVELDQLLHSQSLTFYTAPSVNIVSSAIGGQVLQFQDIFQTIGKRYNLVFNQTSVTKLPPSSLQTFLKSDKELPGLVIGSYNGNYVNRYYHSIFDDGDNLNYTYYNGSEPGDSSIQTYLAAVSTTLAQSLYRLITNESVSNVTVKSHMIDEMLHCYLDTMNCNLFNAVTYKQHLEDKAPNFYVGVNHNPSLPAQLTGQLLALLTGEKVNQTEDQCNNAPQQNGFQFIWMNGDTENSSGICIKTAMNYSAALSPAFVLQDYDWASGKYSTWTESIWGEFSVRMFVKPSPSQENLTLSIGAIVLVLSFVIVYFLNSRSHILFGNVIMSGVC